MLLVYLLTVVCGVAVSDAARILVAVPLPSISHQIPFRPLTQELARRGHDVVVITTDPAFPKGQAPANLTEIDVHDMSYKIWSRFYYLSVGEKNNGNSVLSTCFVLMTEIFERHVQYKEVSDLFTQKFDLIILEDFVRPALALIHVFKAPVILMSSFNGIFHSFEVMGATTHPYLYPLMFRRKLFNLTLWEKVTELYQINGLSKFYFDWEKEDEAMIKRNFGPDFPSISELYDKVDMMFLNVHPIWDENRPVPPSVVYIGGIHPLTQKDLPEDLQTYMDNSKNGVIYFSLGTNVKPSELPAKSIEAFMKVFARLPYNVLWKWDIDVMPGKPDNVKISKWLPQTDILRHPNTKLFITQGGLQSTDEAIKCEVPLIGIPMLGDQWSNTDKYVKHGIGIKLNFEVFGEEMFENAIKTIMSDDSYRHNVKRLHRLMDDQPQTSLERAVWWCEHLIRHGSGRHLRSPAANLSWWKYLEMDLVLAVFLCSLTVFLVVGAIFYYVLKYLLKLYAFNLKLKKN